MKRVLLFKERNNEKPALLWKSSLSSSLPPTSVRVILSLPPPALGASPRMVSGPLRKKRS